MAIGNLGQVGAEGFQLCCLLRVDDAQWGGFGLVFARKIPSGVVVFITLCVDKKMGFAALAIGVGGCGEHFGAFDRQKFDVKSELPALGGCDGRADAGVTARADAQRDDFYGGALELALLKD